MHTAFVYARVVRQCRTTSFCVRTFSTTARMVSARVRAANAHDALQGGVGYARVVPSTIFVLRAVQVLHVWHLLLPPAGMPAAISSPLQPLTNSI